jgi:hypothetical protein
MLSSSLITSLLSSNPPTSSINTLNIANTSISSSAGNNTNTNIVDFVNTSSSSSIPTYGKALIGIAAGGAAIILTIFGILYCRKKPGSAAAAPIPDSAPVETDGAVDDSFTIEMADNGERLHRAV